MSRPGNTKRITDSTDSVDASKASRRRRSDQIMVSRVPAGLKTLGCRQQPSAHELSYRVLLRGAARPGADPHAPSS